MLDGLERVQAEGTTGRSRGEHGGPCAGWRPARKFERLDSLNLPDDVQQKIYRGNGEYSFVDRGKKQ